MFEHVTSRKLLCQKELVLGLVLVMQRMAVQLTLTMSERLSSVPDQQGGGPTRRSRIRT
jgi:hypothetical protein